MPTERHDEPEPAAPDTARASFPRVPLVIGVIAVVALLGAVFKGGSDKAREAEVAAVRTEVAAKAEAADDYRAHLQNLRWRAGKIRAWADAQTGESVKSWARERARLYDGLVARFERGAAERDFAALTGKIGRLCAAGKPAEARALAAQLPVLAFPKPAEFAQAQRDAYLTPLAEASHRTPEVYRAFQQQEPEAAQEDIAALREKLAATDAEAVTPQQMFEVELLGAVAPPDDPVVADWSALAKATDYFENPDGAVLAHWRKAQQAIRLQEWPTAVVQMQSILRMTVRTRHPFRAAYGWALLKNNPGKTAEAYPFLEEAAATGDKQARAWLASEDLAQGRDAQALRRLEAAVMDGEAEAVPEVLKLYERREVPRDPARETGVLQRIVTAPDAPPNAEALLARHYESGLGVAPSAEKAFACYSRAAAKGYEPAWPEVARCDLRGMGTAEDPDGALDWAGRAFASGEREKSLPILIELLERQPERATGAVQAMFDREEVVVGHGYRETREEMLNLDRLRGLLARRLDEQGRFGPAARFYAAAAKNDPAVARRYGELTTGHPCETCGGVGKIQVAVPCPTCGGTGETPCSHCEGRGYVFVPGAPPCTVCGGSGSVLQDGRRVKCAACDGLGRGHDSVTKKDCSFCAHGRVPCPDCTGGKRQITKECPDCHGAGHWTLADRGAP